MDLHSIQDRFFLSLKEFLHENGYVFKGEPYFVKDEMQLTKTIGFTVSTYYRRVTVIPNILIRSKQMAQAMAGFDGDRFKEEYYFTIRMTQEWLSVIFNRPEHMVLSHLLEDETSVNNSVVKFKSFLTEFGFSFFDRFKTLSDFDEWFNSPLLGGGYNFKVGSPGSDAKEGLVAARLNKNPRYEELYTLWIEGLTKEGKYTKTIETIKSLKSYLDGYTI